MLSDEELLIFHQSVDRVRRVAARSLGQLADAGRAVDFVANLHRGLDQVAARAAQVGPVPDCRAGCAYCCHVRVEATDLCGRFSGRIVRDVDPRAKAPA